MIKTLLGLKRKKISIVVKEWYHSSVNNTYHNVKICIDDKIYISGFNYGYEKQWIDTTIKALQDNKIFTEVFYNDNYKDVRGIIESSLSRKYYVRSEKLCKNNDF